jgi:hypothetical protein
VPGAAHVSRAFARARPDAATDSTDFPGSLEAMKATCWSASRAQGDVRRDALRREQNLERALSAARE